MRTLLVVALALTAGCGSVLMKPDGGGTCTYNGVTQPPGTTIPAGDGCNTCGCTASGEVVCTRLACPIDSGQDNCAFDATYTYGDTGGFVAYIDQVTLSPPAGYRHLRTQPGIEDPPAMVCSPLLPACKTVDAIDVFDVMSDIADADVQRALALTAPPTFGRDARPVDGTIFQFLRDDGHGFLVGYDCAGSAGCVDAPLGVTRLVNDLRALDAQQLHDPSCASFLPPL